MQPVVAPHIELLFQEFMRRYLELQEAKKLKTIWFVCTMLFGLAVIFPRWIFPNLGLPFTGVSIILLFTTLRKYMRQSKLVNHLSVNVHILYHHLLGRLEVGFCAHTTECDCAEEFRRYVWQNYRISLYGGSLEERWAHGVNLPE